MGIADGKRALVIGVANDRSIAWSITQELAKQGAQIAMTYQGEALKKRVEPLAEQVGANIIGELDVTVDEQIESTLVKVKALWGGLDMLVHAVAFAEREDLARSLFECEPQKFCALAGNQRLLAGRPRARRRTIDGANGRRDSHAHLYRRGPRDPELQRDGRREGGAGSLRALSRR